MHKTKREEEIGVLVRQKKSKNPRSRWIYEMKECYVNKEKLKEKNVCETGFLHEVFLVL